MKAVLATSVFRVVNPKYNIRLKLHNFLIEEAVLLKFAYNPLAEGTFGSRLDHPDTLEPARKINYWQELPISRSKKYWANRTIPKYAVWVEEVKEGKFTYKDALVVKWTGGLRITGLPPWGLSIVGTLTGTVDQGVYEVDSIFPGQDKDRLLNDERPEVSILTNAEDIDNRILETLAVKTTPVNVETSPTYTGDKFTRDPITGHFIGDDGFRVPLNFEEFWERYPHYIRNWVKKRLHKNIVDADVEDWEMELYQHMKYLPERSKSRTVGYNGRVAGCTDVVETFNPILQYGASEKRFRNYINMCLSNRFNTIVSKQNKNPICRPGNCILSSQMDPENYEVVDDEYVHTNSEHLMHITMRDRRQHEQKLFLSEYRRFVESEDPSMLAVIEAIASTGTFGEAQRELGMTEQDFNRARNRLKQLKDCFLNRAIVPKQRKPYKKRAAIAG